jgi:hypothetical protein
MAELFALFVADDRSEVLNLDQPLADKHYLGYVGDTGNPGVADQLRIESQQSCGFFRVPAGGGLPLQQATSAVQIARGIDVGDKVILAG